MISAALVVPLILVFVVAPIIGLVMVIREVLGSGTENDVADQSAINS